MDLEDRSRIGLPVALGKGIHAHFSIKLFKDARYIPIAPVGITESSGSSFDGTVSPGSSVAPSEITYSRSSAKSTGPWPPDSVVSKSLCS